MGLSTSVMEINTEFLKSFRGSLIGEITKEITQETTTKTAMKQGKIIRIIAENPYVSEKMEEKK